MPKPCPSRIVHAVGPLHLFLHAYDIVQILKVMLSARTAADTPAASKTKLKQQVLLRMADLMVKGEQVSSCVIPICPEM